MQLLGPPSVTRAGERCGSLSAPRTISLLALLILEAKPEVTRAQLGEALWPRHAETERQNNLRVALHRLRLAWPGFSQALAIDRYAVSWREPSLVYSDLDALCETLDRPVSVAEIGQISDLLGGALLEGHDARWIQAHRRLLQRRLTGWLARAVGQLEASRTPAPAMVGLHTALAAPPQDAQGWQQLLSLAVRAVAAGVSRQGAGAPAHDVEALGAEERALISSALELQAERMLAAGLRVEALRSRELAARLGSAGDRVLEPGARPAAPAPCLTGATT